MSNEIFKGGRNNGRLLESGGSLHVSDTVVGEAQSRDRLITGMTTARESATWNEPVHEVIVTAFGEAGGTAGFPGSVAICFGAPSDAAADAWLTYAESKAADVGMKVVPLNVPRKFQFSGAGITRLDIKKLYGGEATLGVLVEAA